MCSNWLYIVKKIIYYSYEKSKDINNIRFLTKTIKHKIDNIRSLNFLYEYTDYYIKKYLEFFEKAKIDKYKFHHINQNECMLEKQDKDKNKIYEKFF